jgi:hypothetical protein
MKTKMFVILFAGLFSFISSEKDVLTIEPEETRHGE